MAATSGIRRRALEALQEWSRRNDHKPLLLRGARQVGKSFLVRQLAEAEGLELFEVNLERMASMEPIFRDPDPSRILAALELRLRRRIDRARTLLFLDEIQMIPEAFRSLRYFREEMADLRVIAAGSLLDLLLRDRDFSVPVGRIEYFHLMPLTFEEFLRGRANEPALGLLEGWFPGAPLSQPEHQALLAEFRIYMALGGMPEVVATFITSGSFLEAERVKESLMATFRDDFAKYRRRIPEARLWKVLEAIPRRIGSRFRYVDVDPDERSRDVKEALDLLGRARLVHRVHRSAGTGVPLGATRDDRRFKVLHLDVGLVSTICGLDITIIEQSPELTLVNAGALAEQVVGQELLATIPPHRQPELYCWMRDAKSSTAEVDYLLEDGPRVVPVEVKAGRTGHLRSLHQFVEEHRPPLALRLNSYPPSEHWLGERADSARLLSLPLYLAGQVRRILGR